MPISFTRIEEPEKWRGTKWTITDEDQLAHLVARVAIGQANAISKILDSTDDVSGAFPKGGFIGAKKLLTTHGEYDIYHRDGWLFQVISWVAVIIKEKGALIRPPQMIWADKGLDGLMIQFRDGDIAYIVISEDKATENPRSKITSEVWPEFVDFESGARDNELIASVTSLLSGNSARNADEIVTSILWHEKRAYRASVTIGSAENSADGHRSLFKGYEDKVSGPIEKRNAETLYIEDIREWLANLAQKALIVVEEAEKLAGTQENV